MSKAKLDILALGIRSAISEYHLTFREEVELQNHLQVVFTAAHLNFEREFWLSEKDRVDFYINCEPFRIALEVKVGGGINAHLRQLKRYSLCPEVDAIILVATKPFSVPETLSGIPCYCINIAPLRL